MIIGLGIAVATPVYAFVSTSSHDVKVHKFARGSTTATCPKGEHVAFGGVVAQYQPAGPGPKYVLPTGMRRTADDRLTAYGFDNSRATEGHLTAVAHCDRGNVPTTVEKSELLPGGEGGSVVATCPAGTVVVAAFGGTVREDRSYNDGTGDRGPRVEVAVPIAPSDGAIRVTAGGGGRCGVGDAQADRAHDDEVRDVARAASSAGRRGRATVRARRPGTAA